jgi:hypothetical protein
LNLIHICFGHHVILVQYHFSPKQCKIVILVQNSVNYLHVLVLFVCVGMKTIVLVLDQKHIGSKWHIAIFFSFFLKFPSFVSFFFIFRRYKNVNKIFFSSKINLFFHYFSSWKGKIHSTLYVHTKRSVIFLIYFKWIFFSFLSKLEKKCITFFICQMLFLIFSLMKSRKFFRGKRKFSIFFSFSFLFLFSFHFRQHHHTQQRERRKLQFSELKKSFQFFIKILTIFNLLFVCFFFVLEILHFFDTYINWSIPHIMHSNCWIMMSLCHMFTTCYNRIHPMN